MDNSFNFLNQPVISALKDAASLLPGLKQVELLFFDQNKNKLQLKRVKANEAFRVDDIIIAKEKETEINTFMKYMKGTSWQDPLELPFSSSYKMKKHNSIFDEIMKSVLCIGFPNSVDNTKQIFIFYFRIDASEFGPMRDDMVLETTQKIVIERLLYSSLKAILNNYIQNRKAMVELNNGLQGLLLSKQKRINKQEKDLIKIQKEMDLIIVGLLNEVNTEGFIVNLTDGSKEILRSYLSNTSFLKTVLRKALVLAKTISFGLVSEEIILHEDYFSDLAKDVNHATEPKPEHSVDEYSVSTKMYRFLDSLEKASQKLGAQGVKLTSSNVGSVLEVPITAAAISDKLKNHSKKINLLLRQYPDNWTTIRYKFRPVVNIQEKASEFKVA